MQGLPQYCLQLDRESSGSTAAFASFPHLLLKCYSFAPAASFQDDQDVEIGGWDPMKQTQALLQKNGGLLTNWRIHTPICSPSRSETVSGRYCKLRNPCAVKADSNCAGDAF